MSFESVPLFFFQWCKTKATFFVLFLIFLTWKWSETPRRLIAYKSTSYPSNNTLNPLKICGWFILNGLKYIDLESLNLGVNSTKTSKMWNTHCLFKGFYVGWMISTMLCMQQLSLCWERHTNVYFLIYFYCFTIRFLLWVYTCGLHNAQLKISYAFLFKWLKV